MSKDPRYYMAVTNRDYIKLRGEKRPFWEFLDHLPHGWLVSLAWAGAPVPPDCHRIHDCGAWTYRNHDIPTLNKSQVTAKWALEQYTQYARKGDIMVAPDHMLTTGNLVERRKFNAQQAKDFLKLCPSKYKPMAVCHGHGSWEYLESARALAKLGYEYIAVGGVAGRSAERSTVVSLVAEVRKEVTGVWLHVLGLSAPNYAAAWASLGVNSYDGSSHYKQAFTAGTFYTRDGSKLIKHQAARLDRQEKITAPLCQCKACVVLREDGVDTRSYGSNQHNMGRAAHNVNHLIPAQRRAIAEFRLTGRKSLYHPLAQKDHQQ